MSSRAQPREGPRRQVYHNDVEQPSGVSIGGSCLSDSKEAAFDFHHSQQQHSLHPQSLRFRVELIRRMIRRAHLRLSHFLRRHRWTVFSLSINFIIRGLGPVSFSSSLGFTISSAPSLPRHSQFSHPIQTGQHYYYRGIYRGCFSVCGLVSGSVYVFCCCSVVFYTMGSGFRGTL